MSHHPLNTAYQQSLTLLTRVPAASTLVALLAAAGCADGAGRVATDVLRDSSLAIERVADPVALSDGDQTRLAAPIGAIELADGRILVADKSDRDIKVYSAAGQRLATLGRPGEGPNEFQSMTGLVLKGGVVYAMDSRRLLINRFDAGDLTGLPPMRLSLSGGVPTRLADGPGEDLLVSLYAIGMQNGNLVAVVDTSGAEQGGLLNRRDYFHDDPWLVQRAMPLAATSAGLTFTSLGLGPTDIDIRSTDGTLLATIDYGDIDMQADRRVQSVAALRGDRTAAEIKALAGGDVIHQRRFLYALRELPDSAALLVFRTFNTKLGVDPVEPGEAAVLRRCQGHWQLSTSVPLPGLAAGLSRAGEILVIAYADSSQNQYQLSRMLPHWSSGVECGG